MSGIAAGIRLAHFGKKVCIFERHYAPGGLNSFYAKDGRKYDVGLHAMTNFVKPGVKRAPLNRILRQLRISREELGLHEQLGSRVAFPGRDLRFDNDFGLLESEVAREFPRQVDGFQKLVRVVEAFDDSVFNYPYQSAREAVRKCISDPALEDMIFCPLMYYGSATEDDMDFGQFVVMFKSIFLEGFARPREGIRNIIKLLLKRYKEEGGIRRMRTGVAKIKVESGKVDRLVLDSGEEVLAKVVLSSVGLSETYALCGPPLETEKPAPKAGRLAFTETISVFEEEPLTFGWGDDTIVFFNSRDRFAYRGAEDPVDLTSGVICIPNNFDYGGNGLPEGIVRVTCLANYDTWTSYTFRLRKIGGHGSGMRRKRLCRPAPWTTNVTVSPTTCLLLKRWSATPGGSGGRFTGRRERLRTARRPYPIFLFAGRTRGFSESWAAC